MRQLAVALLVVAAAACATVKYPVEPPPDVQIVQLYGHSDVPFSRGVSFVESQFGIQISNPSTVPITLKHITLQSIGNSTVAMRREDRGFNNVINPGSVGQATINARVYFTSDMSGSPTREPMTVRATINFDSPKGTFNRIVQANINEFPQ